MSILLARLASRAVLKISGPDSASFLQGLITCDVESLGEGEARYGALLSAQGKIQFDFLTWKSAADTFDLDIEATHGEELEKKLRLYKLRAKVEIVPCPNLSVWAAWGDALLHPLAVLPPRAVHDPRIKELGIRIISTGPAPVFEGEKPVQAAVEAAYTAHRHLYGVPEGRRELGFERLFALEANLEELHGVSFKKGCYVGQELTSRMKHKAELKKRLLPFACKAADRLEAGTPVVAGERDIGQVVGGTGETLFALIRLDRIAGVLEGDIPVTADAHEAHLNWPAAYLPPPPR